MPVGLFFTADDGEDMLENSGRHKDTELDGG